MAEAQDCHFCWHIINLSVPWRKMEATFYNGSPTQVQQWYMNFVPYDRLTNDWPFTFYLENFKFGERDDVVVVEKFSISIFVNGNEMHSTELTNYSFSGENWYTYRAWGNLSAYSEEVACHVTIKIQLTFPDIVDQTHHPALRSRDLQPLSSDLMRLLRSYKYTNLTLVTRHPILQSIPVHSYIMRLRWSNFFSEHPVHTIINNAVEVDIPYSHLWTILHYVYSGNFDVADPELRDMEYATGLFQVIDQYKMHHLYKVFVVDASRQERRSLEDLRTDVTYIKVDGPPPDGRTITRTVDPGTKYEVRFHIRFYLNNDDPSFSYTLQTKFLDRFFVHVKLDMETRTVGDGSTFYSVHVRDYAIDTRDESVESGICHFKGIPSEVMDGIRGRRDGERRNRTRHFLRCSLYTSDGTTGVIIQSQGNDRLQVEKEIYKVLSNHMYELAMDPVETDFTLSCPVERPVPFPLHKGLFCTRVPYWSSVLDVAPEDIELPDEATCSLESEAFRILRMYIYSGRMLPIPVGYLDEIEDFVMQGGMEYLKKFIRRRRLNTRRL